MAAISKLTKPNPEEPRSVPDIRFDSDSGRRDRRVVNS
jgi:hypothetical protein